MWTSVKVANHTGVAFSAAWALSGAGTAARSAGERGAGRVENPAEDPGHDGPGDRADECVAERHRKPDAGGPTAWVPPGISVTVIRPNS